MVHDQSVRFLTALGGASTSRVLNLRQIASANKSNPEHTKKPLFLSPVINSAFVLKQRMRSNDAYLFDSPRAMMTKVIAPFDPRDLSAGGRSIIADQRGFKKAIAAFGNYSNKTLDRDIEVLRLMNALPSLDPFLLRQHLSNYKIDVAACYFSISQSDQQSMHEYVTGELTRLTMLLGNDASGTATSRMVSAMLSSDVAEELAPLRETLSLSGDTFREGVFSWRGFLYYKWSMDKVWPHVVGVLKDILGTIPMGPASLEQREYFAVTKRKIVEMVRDNSKHIHNALSVYDASFADLVARQAPKMFRDFLVNAPYMFLELGEKMGAISHIVTFWSSRFPTGRMPMIDADELSTILHDFSSGFGEKIKASPSIIKQPKFIDKRCATSAVSSTVFVE
jgi:hypothetical protein